VLERVSAQRAYTYTQKRTLADWTKEGMIIRASELKGRYER
jgi:hypothetical protein